MKQTASEWRRMEGGVCETKEQLEVVPLLPRWVHSLTPRRQWLLRPLDGRGEGSGREPLGSVRSMPVQKSRTQKSDAQCEGEARQRPGEPQATLGEPAGPCPVASNTTWVGPAGSSSVAYTSPGHRLAFTSWRLSSTYVITSFVRDGGREGKEGSQSEGEA